MNDFETKKVKHTKQYLVFIDKYFSNLFKKYLTRTSSMKTVFGSKKEFVSYLNESEVIELVKELSDKKKIFRKLVKGRTNLFDIYRWGAISLNNCKKLYSLIRKF